MARDVAGREQKGKEKEASGSTQTPFRAMHDSIAKAILQGQSAHARKGHQRAPMFAEISEGRRR